MKRIGLMIMELLAISLGVERRHYREFFEDGRSIMRCNYYPPCENAGLTLGTGPHCDPTSLTILHQDQVGGLQVFANNRWLSVKPRPDALVINIGDTFMVLTRCYSLRLLSLIEDICLWKWLLSWVGTEKSSLFLFLFFQLLFHFLISTELTVILLKIYVFKYVYDPVTFYSRDTCL